MNLGSFAKMLKVAKDDTIVMLKAEEDVAVLIEYAARALAGFGL